MSSHGQLPLGVECARGTFGYDTQIFLKSTIDGLVTYKPKPYDFCPLKRYDLSFLFKLL